MPPKSKNRGIKRASKGMARRESARRRGSSPRDEQISPGRTPTPLMVGIEQDDMDVSSSGDTPLVSALRRITKGKASYDVPELQPLIGAPFGSITYGRGYDPVHGEFCPIKSVPVPSTNRYVSGRGLPCWWLLLMCSTRMNL